MKKLALVALVLLSLVLTACVSRHSDVYGKWGLENCTGPACIVEFRADNSVNYFGSESTYAWDSDKIVINPTAIGETPIVVDPSIDSDGKLQLEGSYSRSGKTITYYGFKLMRGYGK